MFVSVISLLN